MVPQARSCQPSRSGPESTEMGRNWAKQIQKFAFMVTKQRAPTPQIQGERQGENICDLWPLRGWDFHSVHFFPLAFHSGKLSPSTPGTGASELVFSALWAKWSLLCRVNPTPVLWKLPSKTCKRSQPWSIRTLSWTLAFEFLMIFLTFKNIQGHSSHKTQTQPGASGCCL
jgi:hypothetical protein